MEQIYFSVKGNAYTLSFCYTQIINTCKHVTGVQHLNTEEGSRLSVSVQS